MEPTTSVHATTSLTSRHGNGRGTPCNAGFDKPADEAASPANGSHANDDGLATIAAYKRDEPDAATGLGAVAGELPGRGDRSRHDGSTTDTGYSIDPTEIAPDGDASAEQQWQRRRARRGR